MYTKPGIPADGQKISRRVAMLIEPLDSRLSLVCDHPKAFVVAELRGTRSIRLSCTDIISANAKPAQSLLLTHNKINVRPGRMRRIAFETMICILDVGASYHCQIVLILTTAQRRQGVAGRSRPRSGRHAKEPGCG
jgi:hypothetical protein